MKRGERAFWGLMNVQGVIQAVIVGVIMGLVSAAVSTYIEVKMLRHDLSRCETIIDNLVDEATKK